MNKMKKITFVLLGLATMFMAQHAQSQSSQQSFTGAKATLQHYKALYVINVDDAKKIAGTLRNINNALDDPRLKGKLEVELIAFGNGVAVYEKSGSFEKALQGLQAKGVLLAQCENTIRERHIDKNTLFPFISYVPSGNGEIIIRGSQGWVVVHP
jgi:intracellular sulfur oxidation DsrE/DsrF family protein